MENHSDTLSIGLRDLKDGNHHFTFKISDGWLHERELKPASTGINASADVSKVLSGINLILKVQGAAMVTCDLCLSQIELPLSGELHLQYRISEIPGMGDDEIIAINPEEKELNLERELHDLLLIALPMRKVCDDAGNLSICDNEVLQRLEAKEVENTEAWSELKKLLN